MSEPAVERLGRYELLLELARGGMGVVHVARLVGAHGFDRLFAIKRLGRGSGSADVSALLSEARVTARINHPNVVQTFELGEHEGAPFIVMQLVEGVSLARLLRRLSEVGERLAPDLAAWIVGQAAAGAHAAHELTNASGERLNVVHRDISPRNILVSFDGQVYVADFGVAKLKDAERSTTDGVVKGTFAYMSPEQASGGTLDRRTDVFALGVVFHEALTLRRLFAADAPGETVFRVMSHVPPNPRDVRPDVPADLAAIAMCCLEKEPGKRFATAGALVEALRSSARERGAHVDESDLAAVLARHLAADRDELRERIRGCVQSGSSRAAPIPPSADGPNSVVATTRPFRPARPSWRLAVLALAALVAVGATVVWRSRARSSAPPSSALLTSPSPPPPPSQSPAPPQSPPLTTMLPSTSSSPTLSPPHSRPPHGPPLPSARPAPPPPRPSATASSQRGVPFSNF